MGWLTLAKGVLKGIPWWVWALLAFAIFYRMTVGIHNGWIEDLKETSYKSGWDARDAAAKAAVAKAEGEARRLAVELRSRTDEENRRTAGAADALRVRGPGAARCPRPAATAPSRHEPAGGGAVPPAGGVPDEDWIALPYLYAVNQAELCDFNRTEVLAWRDFYAGLTKAWASESTTTR